MKNKFKWLFVIFIALTFNFSYMVSGDSTALARGVAFVVEVDGTAAASAASTGAASAMLAAASGKTGLEDLEGLGEGGGEPRVTDKIHNMHEFFETEFGRSLQGKVRKTNYTAHGQSIYEVTEKTGHPQIDRGDLFYLDKTHGDHLEVFYAHRKAKSVLNLDGSVNPSKTAEALRDARTISKS